MIFIKVAIYHLIKEQIYLKIKKYLKCQNMIL